MATLHVKLLNKLHNAMPKLIVVLINWTLKTQLKMISIATATVKAMTTNLSLFPTPTVALTAMSVAAARLQSAYNGRKNGVEGKAEYIAAAAAMDALLHSQAIYVNSVAVGDTAIIAKSGFTPTTNALVHKTIPVSPDAPGLKTNAGGGLKIMLAKVQEATSYILVLFFGVAGTVKVGLNYVQPSGQALVVTKAKLNESITGIPIGTNVTVIPFAQNSAGISPGGPAVSILVN